jgi:hypothetical protein
LPLRIDWASGPQRAPDCELKTSRRRPECRDRSISSARAGVVDGTFKSNALIRAPMSVWRRSYRRSAHDLGTMW